MYVDNNYNENTDRNAYCFGILAVNENYFFYNYTELCGKAPNPEWQQIKCQKHKY